MFFRLIMSPSLTSAPNKTENSKEITLLATFSSRSLALKSKSLLLPGRTSVEHQKSITKADFQVEMEASLGILPNSVARA